MDVSIRAVPVAAIALSLTIFASVLNPSFASDPSGAVAQAPTQQQRQQLLDQAASDASSDSCVAIAEIGLVDREKTKSFSEIVSTFYSYVMHNKNVTYSQAKSMAASGSIPLGEVLVGLTGSSSKESFHQLQEMDESVVQTYLRNTQWTDTEKEMASKTVADLVKTCFSIPGVHAWSMVNPSDREHPTIQVLYVSGRYDPPDINVNVASETVRCTLDKQLVGAFIMKPGDKKTLVCTRKPNDPNGATISVNAQTTIFSGGALWLPPVVTPQVPCVPIPSDVDQFAIPREESKPRTYGPYCVDSSIMVQGKAEAIAQKVSPDAWAEIIIYLGTVGPENVKCSNIKLTSPSAFTTVAVACQSIFVPARTKQTLVFLLHDSLTNSTPLEMQVHVRPALVPSWPSGDKND